MVSRVNGKETFARAFVASVRTIKGEIQSFYATILYIRTAMNEKYYISDFQVSLTAQDCDIFFPSKGLQIFC